MATPLTPVISKVLPNSPSIVRYVYEIPSVLPSSASPRYELCVKSPNGEIKQFRLVYPGTTDVVANVFTSDAGTTGTLDHLIATPTIDDGCFSQSGLNIYYENTDPTPFTTAKNPNGVAKLYIEVTNSGGTNATGVVSLELMVCDLVSGG